MPQSQAGTDATRGHGGPVRFKLPSAVTVSVAGAGTSVPGTASVGDPKVRRPPGRGLAPLQSRNRGRCRRLGRH